MQEPEIDSNLKASLVQVEDALGKPRIEVLKIPVEPSAVICLI